MVIESSFIKLMDKLLPMPFSRLTLSLLLLFLALPASAELKKWTDEKGQIHYGDKIPSRYLRKEHQIMNQEGVVIENVPAAKTEEQLREEKRQALIAKIQAEKKRQQDFKDRVLLDTYTTERDLLKAREERLGTFDSLIELTQTIITNNQEQLARLQKRKEEFVRFKKEIPPSLTEQEHNFEQQIIANQNYVKEQKVERDNIEKQFQNDLARYIYLKQQERKRVEEILRRREERKRLEREALGLPENE